MVLLMLWWDTGKAHKGVCEAVVVLLVSCECFLVFGWTCADG